MKNSKRWSSRLNFILAATGAAVGLGAIWKFPYMAGTNGGAAFVLIYIAATIFIGVPIMLAEILLGQLGRKNPIDSIKDLAKNHNANSNWKFLGYWGAIALFLVLAFYSVIAGWSIAYIIKTWGLQLNGLNIHQINTTWEKFLSNPTELLIWHSCFMIMTIWVVANGIHKGLERASRIMMPGLFIVLLILMLYNCIVGDLSAAIKFLFSPDFSKVNTNMILNALGQAAFSLATGAGCMLVYGCYVPEKTKIIPTVGLITFLIILVSILSGLAIFPIVFSFNLSPAGGPGLMFQILPIAFNQMPYGMFFGGLFFLMLWFAAWTSSISMAEPLVVICIEKFNLSRKKSAIIIGCISWLLGVFALLSFNLLQDFKLFNKYTIFSAMADFATNIILPTGALGFALFVGWNIKAKLLKETLLVNSNLLFSIWMFLVKYLAPFAILFILWESI